MDEELADVVVIGSGFGGAVTACRLAKPGRTVLVLERGARYAPGDFPRSPLEMSTNVWDPSEGLFGLFQLWSFRRLDAIVASGVGGGSLIYANVLLRMPCAWFDVAAPAWPLAYDDIARHYPAVEAMMGANPVPRHLLPQIPKVEVFENATRTVGLAPVAARLAVTFSGPDEKPGARFGNPACNLHDVQRYSCRLCGQCDFGCNDGAKNTLDMTYLSRAKDGGADIRALCEVKRITAIPAGGGDPDDEEYRVDYVVHEPPEPRWDRRPRPAGAVPELRSVRTRTVVMAAGAFGSTRLLLANRAGLPRLSPRLGTGFSGNGDAFGFLTGGRSDAQSQRGPVITRLARVDDGSFFLEDGGYPGVLSWLGESIQPPLLGRALRIGGQRWWERLRGRADSNVNSSVSRLLGKVALSRSTLPLLAMGVDHGTGTMRLHGTRLDLDWTPDRSDAYLKRVWRSMRAIATESGSTFRAWRSNLLSRAVSVHPLGGCPMGVDAAHGVVDSVGRAFGHRGLFVVDGSVMPGPIGANPSLTIAALAERFSEEIEKRVAAVGGA